MTRRPPPDAPSHACLPTPHSLFDNLLLLKAGQVVYLGPAEPHGVPASSPAANAAPGETPTLAWPPGHLRDYFASVKHPIPAGAAAADVVGTWNFENARTGLHARSPASVCA